MTEERKEWHLNKSIPLGLIAAILLQTLGLVVWGVRLDSRVGYIESRQADEKVREQAVNTLREKLILIEERQNNVLRVLESNGRKIDFLIDEAGKGTKLQRNAP